MFVTSEITLGDALTIITIVGAVVGFVYSLYKDRQAKRRIFAQEIRNSASLVSAKVERLARYHVQTYDAVQELFVDADAAIVAGEDANSVRDHLWKSLVQQQTRLQREIHSEGIEVAYAGLSGYDPNIQALFTKTLNYISRQGEFAFEELLAQTQHIVLEVGSSESGVTPAFTGNLLRQCAAQIERSLIEKLNVGLDNFRSAISDLISASDRELFERSVEINLPDALSDECSAIVAKHKAISDLASNQSSDPSHIEEFGDDADGSPVDEHSNNLSFLRLDACSNGLIDGQMPRHNLRQSMALMAQAIRLQEERQRQTGRVDSSCRTALQLPELSTQPAPTSKES